MTTRLRQVFQRLDQRLTGLYSRGLPSHARMQRSVLWPLLLLPIFLVNQLLTPHPVWVVLIVFIVGIYVAGYWWLRVLARAVTLTRTQRGAILVAGDVFEEDFTLDNSSHVPVLWAEIVDQSTLPAYGASRVVSVGSVGQTRWRTTTEGQTRGVYRIGPAVINTGDPFGLFRLELNCPDTDSLLIYPRVLQLPGLALPRGSASGVDRRRQTLMGELPGASVREYRQGDSLRHIHWRSSAHRGELTVRELELEPAGDVWLVLDLHDAAHSGQSDASTFEYAIMVAASAAAALLDGAEQRAVGLLAVSGGAAGPMNGSGNGATDGRAADDLAADDLADVVRIPPQPGRAQLWRIMAALAPVRPTRVSLARLLRQNADTLGRRRSLIIITPQPPTDTSAEQAPSWLPGLLQIQAAGLSASTLLVAQDADRAAADVTRTTLAQLDVPTQVLPVSAKLPPLVTYRRKRTIYRSTPTGGVVVQEIEEEVG